MMRLRSVVATRRPSPRMRGEGVREGRFSANPELAAVLLTRRASLTLARRPHPTGERSGSSGVLAEMAAEGVRLLHERLARHDLGNLPVILLVLHVLRRFAFDDDDGTDELVVGGAEVHVAHEGRERLLLLVGLDDLRRIEGAGLLDHPGPDRKRHVGVL